jgi:hypothetical protein
MASNNLTPTPASLPAQGMPKAAIPPAVHIPPVPYRPGQGEFVTRQTGSTSYLGQIIYTTDPGTPTSGSQVYKYGVTALNPNVKQILNLLVSGPFWSQYHIAPDNDYETHPDFEAIDMQLTAFIDVALECLQHESFRNVLKAIWQDAYTYGFSVSEFNWAETDDDGMTWLDSIKVHSPFQFDIYTDQTNELQSLYYRTTGQIITKDILEKFLVVTYPYLSHGNYYGQSGLIAVEPDVKFIELLERAQSEGIRALAIKSLEHHFLAEEMSDQQVEEVKTNLAAIQAGSVISFPASQDKDGKFTPKHVVKVIDDRASSDGLKIITDLLSTLYKRVSRNMGLPDDLGFTGTNVGSLAKASEESNLYLQALVDAQNFITTFVNRQIIPLLIKYNYPSVLDDPNYRVPRFTFATVDTNQNIDLYPLLAALNANAISLTEFRKAASFDGPLDVNDTLSALLAAQEVEKEKALVDPNAPPVAEQPETTPTGFAALRAFLARVTK